MESRIEIKGKDELIISWEKEGVGFGQLTMDWDGDLQRYTLDSECMGIDTVIEIFKALK